MRIGVETYTIRKQQKKNLTKAYFTLIEKGFRYFELSKIKFNQKNAEIIRDLIDNYKIHIVSILAKPDDVFHHADQLISFCHQTNCTNVVISMLPFKCILGPECLFYLFLNKVDEMAEIYQKAGIVLAYHHHNWEFDKVSNGKRRMDELVDRTEKIQFVLDTYWCRKCNGSPEVQMKQFGNRLLGMHLRDYVQVQKGLKKKSKDGVIGTGVLDFQAILKLAEELGCEYGVFEHNTNQPYEDLVMSFQNCQRILNDRGDLT